MLNETDISILSKITLQIEGTLRGTGNISKEKLKELIKPAYNNEQKEYLIQQLRKYKGKKEFEITIDEIKKTLD